MRAIVEDRYGAADVLELHDIDPPAIGSEHLTELRKLIESGAVTPVLDRSFTLAEAPEAIRHLAGGHPNGKIFIAVR